MACWIRGCETKGGKHVSRKRSLFTPRTEKMLNNWQNSEAVTKGINNLSKASRICELHFMDKDILREDVLEMTDGSVVTIPRKIPKLMEDAIPCNFPPQKISFCSENSIYEEKRKEQLREQSIAVSHSIVHSSVPETYESHDPTFASGHNSSTNRSNNEVQTWAEFTDKLKNLTLPSEFWTPIITAESAMWVCWKTDLSSCVRRIVLKTNMTFCVFIGEKEIDCLSGKVDSIHQIQSLLKKISYVHPCKEVGNKTCSSFCCGYVTRDCTVRGVQRDRCISCAKYIKNRIQRTSNKPIKNKKLVKSNAALRLKCKNFSRSNMRLRQKTLRLKEKVESLRTQCAQANTQAVEEAISKLPINQQLSVQACFAASKVQNNKGVLLLDEMKVSKTLTFNRNNFNIEGFTNLGKYTPKKQASKRGDHALVFMFQPFKGKWVQVLGCFLSLGSASGTILHQLVMECIILVENSGFKIHAVTSDGASWNRAMWDKFGVTEKEVSVPHIIDSERRLWFISDFPHLIKCLRNFFSKHTKYESIWTPDGMLSLKHWYALLAIENPNAFNLKVNYKLTEQHIKPKYYQKMNVALAFQFFGVAYAMALFRNDHVDLADCDGSLTFCTRLKALITAMNSRTPMEALKPGNQMWKDIDFLQYLNAWEKEAKQHNYEFITSSTCYGLKVSLTAALEICSYLVKKCNFNYLMTARLNQDNLERFFGMMRHCCGSNEHPDSQLFIQMYKLVSTYSLVKPPKGCNVAGGELMHVLLSIKDIKDPHERQQQWLDQIDTILDKGTNVDILVNAATELDNHDYYLCTTSEYVLSYIAGYVARKSQRFIKFGESKQSSACDDCLKTLVLGPTEEIPETHRLILLKTKGCLKHPSAVLISLLSILEQGIIEATKNGELNALTFFNITNTIATLSQPLPRVGCKKHESEVTHKIIRFFLTTRMHFLCKQSNKNNNAEKEKTKERRKNSKLSQMTDINVQSLVCIQNI